MRQMRLSVSIAHSILLEAGMLRAIIIMIGRPAWAIQSCKEKIFCVGCVPYLCYYYWLATLHQHHQQSTCVVSVNPTKSAHCTLCLFVLYIIFHRHLSVWSFANTCKVVKRKYLYLYTQALTLDLIAHDCISYLLVLAARCTRIQFIPITFLLHEQTECGRSNNKWLAIAHRHPVKVVKTMDCAPT